MYVKRYVIFQTSLWRYVNKKRTTNTQQIFFKTWAVINSGLLSNLTWDQSMAIHLGQSKRLQVCMTLGLGAYMHFHSSTCSISPCMDSSTHTKLRLWIPPPQDTEHAVQGLCSQLKSKQIGTHYLLAACVFVSSLQRWLPKTVLVVVPLKELRAWRMKTLIVTATCKLQSQVLWPWGSCQVGIICLP